ncbi:hypothetical protein SDC9_206247 [bioreactor metagenome]|uniref:Uncharacterized protein n=1 Tax=bioreactor metagenome TaxID=1076179 RepID=A0A645J4H6_9ZZZZ
MQLALQQVRISIEIAGHDDQQKVLGTRDAVEHHHLGNSAHSLLEVQRRLFVLVIDRHHHKGQHAKAHGPPVQRSVIAGDHALVLEMLDAPP